MSYILEALKKSDKERQREQIPDLQADHSLPSVKIQERKGPGLYLLGALVLGSVAGLLWWQFSGDQVPQLTDNSKIPPAPVAVAPAPEVVEIPEQTAARPSVAKKEKAVEPVTPEVTTVEPTASEQPVPEVAESEVPLPEDRTPGGSEALVKVAEKSAPSVTPEPVGQEDVIIPLLDELPPNVKADVPGLSFAGHVYADDTRKRLIIINSRIVREGDMVSNGLFLEQISPDGVVLRYKTVVFRVQLF